MKIHIIIDTLAVIFMGIIVTFTIRYFGEQTYPITEFCRDVAQYGFLFYAFWMPFTFGAHAHPDCGSGELFTRLTQYSTDYFILMLALYQCKSKTFRESVILFLVYMIMVNKEYDMCLLAQLVCVLALFSGLFALAGWALVCTLHKEWGHNPRFFL